MIPHKIVRKLANILTLFGPFQREYTDSRQRIRVVSQKSRFGISEAADVSICHLTSTFKLKRFNHDCKKLSLNYFSFYT